MKTPRTRIASVVADRTLQNGISEQLSKELAAFLLSEHRVNDLDSVLRDVQADWANSGYVEVLARSAHPLSAETKADIITEVKKLFPSATKIVVTDINDPEIIGGVRLNVASKQWDLSIEAQLNKFKQLTMAGKE